jgi:hypothetical protein
VRIAEALFIARSPKGDEEIQGARAAPGLLRHFVPRNDDDRCFEVCRIYALESTLSSVLCS